MDLLAIFSRIFLTEISRRIFASCNHMGRSTLLTNVCLFDKLCIHDLKIYINDSSKNMKPRVICGSSSSSNPFFQISTSCWNASIFSLKGSLQLFFWTLLATNVVFLITAIGILKKEYKDVSITGCWLKCFRTLVTSSFLQYGYYGQYSTFFPFAHRLVCSIFVSILLLDRFFTFFIASYPWMVNPQI